MTDTPLKLESPADSISDNFGSPDQQYASLFHDHEGMTPQSYDDDSMFGGSMAGETPGPEAQSKKPVKKRKSWGQQLPEPKTNLPPRKRAKTEDEKEQRRVERVLRNRRAAQSSRERKRQEVEALEAEKHQVELRNQDLEHQLAEMHAKCVLMQQQLEAATGGKMTIFGASAPSPTAHTEQFRRAPSPVTLSQPLFGASESALGGHRDSFSSESSEPHSPSQTVNPASLSPPSFPVEFHASTSDLTQQPAVSVGSATALDLFGAFEPYDTYDYSHLMEFPQPSQADLGSFADGILALPDASHLVDDYLSDHHHGQPDDFFLHDFLHHDEDNQPSPDVQSEVPFVDSPADLQPAMRASSSGCDMRANAVNG